MTTIDPMTTIETSESDDEKIVDKIERYGINSGGIRDQDLFDRWKPQYEEAFKLEHESPDKIFLFSAQPKNCILLSIILTIINRSETIIWRPDTVSDLTIDRENTRERDINAVNMSASLSLLDWAWWESANSFLINGSVSNVNQGACIRFLRGILGRFNRIVNKYKDKLLERYLVVFEFTDNQLKNYVRLSKSWGVFVLEDNEKETIKRIQDEYSQSTEPLSNNIQARILITTPNSRDPYTSHILSPDDILDKYREEIQEEFDKISITATGKRSKKNKRSKNKRSKKKRSKK